MLTVSPEILEFFVKIKKGKTLETFLKELGVGTKEIENIKNGKIHAKTLILISEKLDVNISRLLDQDYSRATGKRPKNFRKSFGEKEEEEKVEKELANIFLEIADLLGIYRLAMLGREQTKETLPVFTLDSDPKKAGEFIRKRIGLERKIQVKKWKKAEDAFEWLRSRLMKYGVLVFLKKLPKGIDGISFAEGVPKVIVVQKHTFPTRQLFTLAHELAHILLNMSVYEDVDEGLTEKELEKVPDHIRKVERWCNEFAAYFLLPEEFDSEIREIKDEELLSKRYKVSPTMILVRMSKLGIKEFKPSEKEYKPKSGRSDPVARSVRELGKGTLKALINAHRKGYVKDIRLMRLLHMSGKSFEKLMEVVEE